MKMAAVILCLLLILLNQEVGCSTYHFAILGASNVGTAKSVKLQYEPSDSLIRRSLTSRLSSCDSSLNINNDDSADTTKLLHGDCGDLFQLENGISGNGIKVDMAENLYVYMRYDGKKQDGFLAIPDEYLGNEYYILTYCSVGGVCQFAVVGTVNHTRVNIIFPATFDISSSCSGDLNVPVHARDGNTVSIVLNESDVFYYESLLDLSGVYVYSDKVVSVFAGTRDFPADDGETTSLIEQIPPTNKWGTHFIAAPFYLNSAGDVYKIISQSKQTKVYIQGFSPFVLEEAGQSIEKRIDHDMYIEIMTSKPTLIVQILSVDLFNNTVRYTGKPTMTLIPHTEQLQTQNGNFRCDDNVWYVVLALKYSVAPGSNIFNFGTMESLQIFSNSQYGVVVMRMTASVVTIVLSEVYSGGYMFCAEKMATHIGLNWSWNNEGCVTTAAYPGDGIDNNCNGEIDEVNCTADDLVTTISVGADSISGSINFYQTNIRGARYFDIAIPECSEVVLELKNQERPKSSVSIIILKQLVTIVCGTGCSESLSTSAGFPDCNRYVKYGMKWYHDGNDMVHHIFMYNSNVEKRFRSSNAYIGDYDKLFVTSFGDQVKVLLGLTDSDCARTPARGTTFFGREFTIPIHSAQYYDVIITSPNNKAMIDVIETGQNYTINAMTSLVLTQANFVQNYQTISIVSYDADVAVFFTTNLDNMFKGLHIYPTESSSFTYQLRSSATTGPACFAHPTNKTADTNIGTVYVSNTFISKQQYESMGSHHTLTSNRPLAVFCKTIEYSLVQMNPTETFGTRFFIPPLNLTTIEAQGNVVVVSSEDSTVVIYKGAYDLLVTLEKAGDEYTRTYMNLNDLIIEVTSSKPVQVILQLWRDPIITGLYQWNSVIYIPSVDHYTTIHYFPSFASAGSNSLLYTSAIDSTGNLVNSQLVSPLSTVQAMTYASPTFSITTLTTTFSQIVVFPSNHLLGTINKDCTITKDRPGDDVDGDCDGLIDEEECSLYNVDGSSFIDLDLDGTLNTDCNVDTQAPTVNTTLEIIYTPCLNTSQEQENSLDLTDDQINIEVNNTPPTYLDGMTYEIPQIIVENVPPTYDGSISVVGQEIFLPENDLTTDITAERCVFPCLCPCGWVKSFVNYTMEELHELVTKLQDHLKVNKPTLSVVKRQKTSAKDNRPSSVAIGYIALFSLVCMICSLVLLDTSVLIRDMKLFVNNIKNICNIQ